MRVNKIILTSFILFISAPVLKSQVIVGSPIEPVKSALFDQKTQNAESTNLTVQSDRADRWFLPQVRLVNDETVDPFNFQQKFTFIIHRIL
jgi:hypothetical protein